MSLVSYQLRGTIDHVVDLEFHGTQEDAGQLIGAVTEEAYGPSAGELEILGIQQRTPDEDDEGTAAWVMFLRVRCDILQFGSVVTRLNALAGGILGQPGLAADDLLEAAGATR
jgi:hypothetical protein